MSSGWWYDCGILSHTIVLGGPDFSLLHMHTHTHTQYQMEWIRYHKGPSSYLGLDCEYLV